MPSATILLALWACLFMIAPSSADDTCQCKQFGWGCVNCGPGPCPPSLNCGSSNNEKIPSVVETSSTMPSTTTSTTKTEKMPQSPMSSLAIAMTITAVVVSVAIVIAVIAAILIIRRGQSPDQLGA